MDDETLAKLCETYRGMSADEIEAAIVSSKHAGRITDPKGLAAYVASLCAAS